MRHNCMRIEDCTSLEKSLRKEISPVCQKYLEGKISLRKLYEEISLYIVE